MKKKPTFRRSGFLPKMKKRGKLATSYRRPRGKDNKQRRGLKCKPKRPKIGYGNKNTKKNTHPSGLKEQLVSTPKELEKINPKTTAARIRSSVGKKKSILITQKAAELKIRVLNPVDLEQVKKQLEEKKKLRQKKLEEKKKKTQEREKQAKEKTKQEKEAEKEAGKKTEADKKTQTGKEAEKKEEQREKHEKVETKNPPKEQKIKTQEKTIVQKKVPKSEH